jgi:hypothetical protein
MTTFSHYLTSNVGLAPETASNYTSAATRVRVAFGLTKEDTEWPEAPPPAVWEYVKGATGSWKRTIAASWNHYRDWCGVMDRSIPPGIDTPAAIDMPDDVVLAVRGLVTAVGINTVQRLRWNHIRDGAMYDHKGEVLTRARQMSGERLQNIITALHTWGCPIDEEAPLVPDEPASLTRSTRQRLKAIIALGRTLQTPGSAISLPSVHGRPPTKIDEHGLHEGLLAGGFAPPSAEALAAANLGSTLTPEDAAKSTAKVTTPTGRDTTTLDELKKDLHVEGDMPAWMAAGLQAEVTGVVPEGE